MDIHNYIDNILFEDIVNDAKSNGLIVTICDKNGVFLKYSNFQTTFCRKSEDGNVCLQCFRENVFAIEESMRFGEVYIMNSHTYLIFLSLPIMINQEVIGGLLTTRIMPYESRELFEDEKYIKNKIYKKYILEKSIPEVNSEQINKMRGHLFDIAIKFNLINFNYFKTKKDIHIHESNIANIIHKKKDNLINDRYILYSYREKELISKIQSGDKRGAIDILNEMLVGVYSNPDEKFEIIKVYVTELLVIISRAAIESGTSSDRLWGMNYSFLHELGSIDNQVDLTHWLVKVLENYIDEVAKTKYVKNRMKSIIDYVYENYKNNIRLEEISFKANLSPSHFAHEFKKETGMSFISFVNDIKLKKSTEILISTNLSIIEIAIELGFTDQSYFIRKFKSKYGITPFEYRKSSKRII